jgi:pimeloyl-ACP methyl ester carboxylesterase
MGGLVSLMLAQRCHGRLLGFVDIKGNLAPEDCFLSRQIYQYPMTGTPREFTDAFLERAKRSGFHGDTMYTASFRAKFDVEGVRPTFVSMVETTDTQDLLGQFITFRCPKMFMYGEQFASLSYLARLEAYGVDVGHFIMYSNPVGMWDRIYEFVRGVEAGVGLWPSA